MIRILITGGTFDNTDANKPAAAQAPGLTIGAGCTIGVWTGTGQPGVFSQLFIGLVRTPFGEQNFRLDVRQF